MQRIIIAITTLLAASFLISFIFNDFQVEIRKVGEEFIRMLGIAFVIWMLLKHRSGKNESQ